MNANKIIEGVYHDMAVAGVGSPEAMRVACGAYAKAWNKYTELADEANVLHCDQSMLDEIDQYEHLVNRMKEIVFHTAMRMQGFEVIPGGIYASKF